MFFNSSSLVNNYMVKWVNDPFQSHSEKRLRVERFSLHIDDEIRKLFDDRDDTDFVLVLSQMSRHKRKAFLRFYSVYLFRIYDIKKKFYTAPAGDVDWKKLAQFVNSNDSFKKLLLCCLNVYI